MSEELDQRLAEIADDFGQRSAECALDLSWFDAEGFFRSEDLHAFAVALRAMNCGYGWEHDGNQLVVAEWKVAPDSPIVQIQPQRKVGLNVLDLALLVRGPDETSTKFAILCTEGPRESDAQQDKELRAAGYRTFRYVRTDISDNPARCALEIGMAIADFISPRKHFVA